MGTQKRQRQKANRAMRQAEAERAARTDAVKRNVLRWVLVLIAAVGAVVLIAWIGGAFDGSDDDTPSTTVPITLPEISVATSVASTNPASTAPGSTTAATLPATDATTTVPDQ